MGIRKRNTETNATDIWERQPDESSQAFEAFRTYRDMGADRSQVKVAQKLGKTLTLISTWSINKKWVSRVQAWEKEQDHQIRENLTKGKAAMLKNHTDVATAMLLKAVKALQKIPVEDMTFREIATTVKVATDLERISRGEVTERTESKVEIAGDLKLTNLDLSKLSDDELSKMDELVNKISPA